MAGKRLVVVDDSIVRGNTTRQIVQMLRDAGASEIHMRISAPPIKHPCHYGIDMSTHEEMIAYGKTTEEIAAELGCDSLHYLSLEGVYEAVGATPATHCDACSAAATRSTGPARPTASMRSRSALSRWSESDRAAPAYLALATKLSWPLQVVAALNVDFSLPSNDLPRNVPLMTAGRTVCSSRAR